MPLFLFTLLTDAVGSMLLLSFAIILCSALLEDPTIIIVGVLAADGLIPVPVAFLSLYAGIVLGDIGLYSLGRFARTHPWFARYVEHDFIAPMRTWIENRYVLTVFSSRFIPGTRLPTYIASGFFRVPFSAFALTDFVAVSLWTTAIFSASYWLGSLTAPWLGEARWIFAFVLLLVLFLVGRHNLLSFRAQKH